MLASNSVDGHDLRVEHRRLKGPDRDPALEQRLVRGFAGQLNEALVGVRAGDEQTHLDARVPPAAHRRSIISWSGTKYAVVMRSRSCAIWHSERNKREDVAVTDLGGSAHALHDRAFRAWVGRGTGRSIRRTVRRRSRPSCRGTRPGDRRPPDLATRKCVSRHSEASRASPSHSSAMPTPPMKPIASSTIDHLAMGAVVHLVRAATARAGGTNARARRRPPSWRRATSRWAWHPKSRAVREPALRPRRGRRAVCELGADLSLPIDEGEEIDGRLRRLDRVQHRREDLVAVAQDVDAIALGRGNADDAFDHSADASARSPVGLSADPVGAMLIVPPSQAPARPLARPVPSVRPSPHPAVRGRRRAPPRVARRRRRRRARATDDEQRPQQQRDDSRQRTVGFAERLAQREERAEADRHQHHSAVETAAPNASHDTPAGAGAGSSGTRPPLPIVTRTTATGQRATPQMRLMTCVVDRVADGVTERQERERGDREHARGHRRAGTRARTSAASVGPARRRRCG